MTEVVTTYLEMTSPAQLRAKHSTDPSFTVREAERDWQLNRWLYLNVGEPWAWNDKRNWSEERWQDYAETDALRTFVAEYNREIAGYFELRRDATGDTEIAYFGLLPRYIGRGLGAPLLTSAIEEAWRWNASRVWVHTCTHDHPAALKNYQARGLRVYKTSSRST